jgi:acetolactate synthase-1/2/3 large subunit
LIDPYAFCEEISNYLRANEVIVCANASAAVIPMQTLIVQDGQRIITNSGCAAMGYGLPAAIGACFAGARRVICFEGDGSLQMNIQELQTVAHHQLPIKIFVFNNGGYLSIRTTQNLYFEGRKIGESARSGVSFPDFVKVAEAYGIPATRITTLEEQHENPTRRTDTQIDRILDEPGPFLCDVELYPDILMQKAPYKGAI